MSDASEATMPAAAAPAADKSKEPSAAELALVQPPAKGKLIPIMVGLNTLLVLGVGAMMFLRHPAAPAPAPAAKKAEAAEGHGEAAAEEHGGGEEEAAPAEDEHGGKKPAGPGPTVKLDDFVVRLRNPETDRFARVSFEVQVASDRDKEILTGSMARIRDTFIGELTERTVEELRGTEGLNAMKAALTKRLKELVPNCRIRGLYVTDFIVQ